MFTGTQVIKGAGLFIGVFGLTIMCLAIGSMPSDFSTDSIIKKAERESALKFAKDAQVCFESRHTSISEKKAAVSMAGLAARHAFPDKPSMWEPWYEIERKLEKVQREAIETRIRNW